MKELFFTLQSRLAALTDDADSPLFAYIDEDWGQLDFFEHPPVKFPCVLLDLDDIAVSHEGRLAMLDDATIIVRIADMRISNSSSQAPQYQKNKTFEIFDLIARTVKALHGYTANPDLYGRLKRNGQRRIPRRDGIRIYEITFHTTLRNTAAVKNTLPATNYTPVVAPITNH